MEINKAIIEDFFQGGTNACFNTLFQSITNQFKNKK
jgi:hypothetical protein